MNPPTYWQTSGSKSFLRPVTIFLFVVFAILLNLAPAMAENTLAPGLYQWQDKSSCEIKKLSDGSLYMLFWQGTKPLDQSDIGYAFFGRLVPDAANQRLGISWQALPSSCCPGRGRAEIEILGIDRFNFTSFAPSLDRPAWQTNSSALYVRKNDIPTEPATAILRGAWELNLWYTDILPKGTPADPLSFELDLTQNQDVVEGLWQGSGKKITLIPQEQKIALTYKDEERGFELSASLSKEAQGLSYAGPFSSTLGRGQMVLVRRGLPASPNGQTGDMVGGLSGIWVDPRTGNDFFDLKGTLRGFDFTAYGGLRSTPRYLTKGRARPKGADSFTAVAKDVEGRCCGNQGRLSFRLISPSEMEVGAVWWPQGMPDPETPISQTYVIKKISSTQDESEMAQATRGRWPVITVRRPGLLSKDQGSIKAIFTYEPQEQKATHTIFSQGGYLSDLELAINPNDQLEATLALEDKTVILKSDVKVSTGEKHEAWLNYSVNGEITLILDGKKVAHTPMTTPWKGSNSPYIMGASRWPGRGFIGKIDSVSLWQTVQTMETNENANLVILPPQTIEATQNQEQTLSQKAPTHSLVRLWHPKRLVHTYSVNPEEIKQLESQGFINRGPVARLLANPTKETTGLYAFTNRSKGFTFFLIGDKPPTTPNNSDSLGLLGYVRKNSSPENTPLFEQEYEFKEPVRHLNSQDIFYSTSRENVALSQEYGYSEPKVLCYVLPELEEKFKEPLAYDWVGSFRGEGWGRFFLKRKGNELFMFWYYGGIKGPHYFGRYRLSPDNRSCEGMAVGRPGAKATYYRHQLVFDTDSDKGPRIKLTSWRMAAPMDNGNLVLLSNAKPTKTLMIKTSQEVPTKEVGILDRTTMPQGIDPAKAYEQAVKLAKEENRLEKR